jgi:hypothetical protein
MLVVGVEGLVALPVPAGHDLQSFPTHPILVGMEEHTAGVLAVVAHIREHHRNSDIPVLADPVPCVSSGALAVRIHQTLQTSN